MAVAVVALAVVSAAVATAAFSPTQAQIGPFATTVGMHPELGGGTKVELAPLGNARFESHSGPLGLTVSLDSVDPESAQTLVTDPDGISTVTRDIEGELTAAVKTAVTAGLAGSLALGLLLGGVVFRDRRRALATGGLAVAVTLAAVLNAAGTVRPESISEPTFDGSLVYVPGIVGDVQSLSDNYDEQLANLQKFVTNVSGLYATATRLPMGQIDDDSVRVLHVSDLHLNPLAWQLIETVTEQFDIDVVVDTGDISDYGSEREAEVYTKGVENVDAPYLWVKGNHDSTTTQAVMGTYGNVTVLDDDVVEVAGLRFGGVADPRFTPDKSAKPSSEYTQQILLESGDRLAELIRRQGGADVAMVHEPQMAPPLAGEVPLVLAGHTHRSAVQDLGDGTTLMITGSTGAAGLRNFESSDPMNMELEVLYFDPESKAMRAYDTISVSARDQTDISLKRTVVPEDDRVARTDLTDGDGEGD
ncbi:metallophosphoesterase family protein [Salininema proteolyticum]|uniref:metallophosphoesterase family protein n=1 Tax=Salininema proteolyticum TaxID=1607685 RepID=UPI0036D42B66